jgi:hypothetical protein
MKAVKQDEELETPEVESTDAPEDVGQTLEVPTTETTTSTAPAPTLTKDADQTVKTFSFGGDVAKLTLPPLTTNTKEQTVAFFTAFQDETPTAISLTGNSAIFTYGGQSAKVDLDTLAGLLRSGDVAGDSRLVQSLIVAQSVGELGLNSTQAREITRGFVAALKAGQSPEQARVNAYTACVSCVALGADPKGQLEKDMKTVETFFKNFENPKLAKTMGPVPSPAVKQELTDLLAKRMNAIANNDFAKAFDLQEQAAMVAKKHGLPKLGAEPQAIKEPSNRIAIAADEHQAEESDMTAQLMDMLPGESTEWAGDGEGGVTVGIGVGYKAPVVDVEVASVKAEATARIMGKKKGSVEREESGDYVVTIRSQVAAGLKGNVSATALIELAGAQGGGDIGHLSIQKLRFANARDAAKFLTALDLEDKSTVKQQPTPVENAKSTDRPKAGQYVVVEESSGLATHTESQTRHTGLTKPSEKSSIIGGSGIKNWFRSWLPGSSNKITSKETTRYTNKANESIVERTYKSESLGGNFLFTLFTLGFGKMKATRNQIDLKLRQTTKPITATTVGGPTVETTFKPSLSLQIDSGKVKACKTLEGVEILIKKEFARVLEASKSMNKEAGKDVIDLSSDGQMHMQESVRKAFLLIYNETNRTDFRKDERRVATDADLTQVDVGFKVSKTSLGVGGTGGGLITLKLGFEAQKDGTFRSVTNKVEIGLTKTTAVRFQASLGVDSHDIPGSPVKVAVSVGMKVSSSGGQYTQLLGNSTVKPTTSKLS